MITDRRSFEIARERDIDRELDDRERDEEDEE